VELQWVGGCIVSSWQKNYSDGYNSVSRALTIRKFGADFFDECRRLAEQDWKTSHPDED
jgi:hypothetical protein